MRIESMTASFGKLENAVLRLTPGMNVISAPNEWGKSTWCAFLLAMAYGVDTREKTTKSALAEKEHYAPWSGSPMSGRLQVEWNGRRITIERTTTGRVPLGDFRAYETESGLQVEELTASNCGMQLFGVERATFQRAGFIRLEDLPITANDDFRRRLNALVTTGEEGNDSLRLQKGLHDLKNRICRKPGGQLYRLLQEKAELCGRLDDLHEKQQEHERLQSRLQENMRLQQELQIHEKTLAYRAALDEQQKVAKAQRTFSEACRRLETAEKACEGLPSGAEAQEKRTALLQLRTELAALREQGELPPRPTPPQCPPCFAGKSPEEIYSQVASDTRACRFSAFFAVWCALAALSAAAGGALLWQKQFLYAAIAAGVFLYASVCVGACLISALKRRKTLRRFYGFPRPAQWQEKADEYIHALADFRQQEETYQALSAAAAKRRREMKQKVYSLCGENGLEECCRYWDEVQAKRLALDDAGKEADWTKRQYESVKNMARPLPPEPPEENRTESAEETAALLHSLRAQEQKLREADGKVLGAMEVLGEETALRSQVQALEERQAELEQYSEASELALQVLQKASEDLQRRFAPRISARGQELLSELTGGKYDRLTMDADMTLHAGSQNAPALRQPMWLSDGTADQVYLSLRLAIAQELTPEAPLILDDALLRFDDQRLEAALKLLRRMADKKQVILFSCREREKEILAGLQ